MRLERFFCHYLNTYAEKPGKCILKPYKLYKSYGFFQFYKNIEVTLSNLLTPDISAEDADLFRSGRLAL